MTLKQFENGYWYATDLQKFAKKIGVPSAGKLRKDELEKAIKKFLKTGKIISVGKMMTKKGPKDSDLGLTLNLVVSNYTNNKETKEFLIREAKKMDPGFKVVSGPRYHLNRWREGQIARGKKITYGDLVKQFVHLTQIQDGPLRTEHGRYNNFISDFMAAKAGSRAEAIKAWNKLKKIDAPKTFRAWKKINS